MSRTCCHHRAGARVGLAIVLAAIALAAAPRLDAAEPERRAEQADGEAMRGHAAGGIRIQAERLPQ